MLNAIISFSVKQKLIIALFTFALIGWGIYETTRLPIDAVPDITDNQVQIITVSPALGAPDVERLITFPIEQANSNIPGIKEIRSFSRFGLSLVTIVFDDATDVYWARQQIAERLIKVQTELPSGVGNPELAPVTTGLGEIYQYVVKPKKGYENAFSLTELRTIQDWIIRRQLLGVKGVADVSSFGGSLKQYEVSINPNRLQAYGVTLSEIYDALSENNANTGGAYIEKGEGILYIRSEGLLKNFDDIRNIVIKNNAGSTPLTIGDVAEVKEAEAIRYGAMCYNADGEVAGAIVMMLKGANSSEVIKNVKSKIADIQKTLPEGVEIEAFLDRSKMVSNAIGTVEKNLLEGALIVIFVLVLFLGNLRAGLIVASVIPLSMLFAIIMMNIFGVSGNLMSLGAIDFGLIVDGAVIIVEAIMHQLSHSKSFSNVTRLNQDEMNTQVKSSASKMMNSAVFGQIIILIVYLPIFSLQGIEGKMFAPMAATVAFALLGAFLLSLTYVPMMSSLFISKKIKHQPNFSDKAMFAIERKYQSWLEKILQHPKATLTTVVIAFILSVVVLLNMGGEFIPELEEGDFAVDTRILTGSNLNTTIESTQKTAKILVDSFPEVEKVVTKIGSGEIPTDPMPIEASDMMVILKNKKEWTSAETYDELAEKMSAKLANVPGVTFGFQYPVQMRFNELMTGARQDVVCKIFGEDLDTLQKYAHELGKIIQTVDGAKDLYVEPIGGMPQIVVEYNRAAMAQYGIRVDDVNKVMQTAYAGAIAGKIYEGEKRFDLVLRMDKKFKSDEHNLDELLIPTNNGNAIPLRLVANISIIEGPNQIQREDAKRRIIVGFNVRGRDVQSIVEELQKKVDTKIDLPPGYFVNYGGAFENLEAAKMRLAIAVPISLLLILIMLYFAFGSISQGILIFSAIPLSAIGGVFALNLRDMPFSISAGIGFIALFGVAVLNGIVLIAEFNRLKKEGLKDPKRIVIQGTKIRLRPVLMTASVASLGFIPMALSAGAGAEVQKPLATVVIGGLLSATVLTLFVLPVLYASFSKVKTKTTTGVAIIIMMLISFTSSAQENLSWDDTKLKISSSNNYFKAIDEYKSEMKNIKAGGYEIPKTEFTYQQGQYNSSETDKSYSVFQSFHFPNYYINNNELFKANKELNTLNAEINKIQLLSELHYQYYLINTIKEKLQFLDQVQNEIKQTEQNVIKQYELGQLSVLEKSSVSFSLNKIIREIDIQKIELKQQLLYFNLLLGSKNNEYSPIYSIEILNSNNTNSTEGIFEKKLKQIETINRLSWKTERSKLYPDIKIGYTNQSLNGILDYGRPAVNTDRFQFISAGISVPIFFTAQNAKNKMAKLEWEQSKYIQELESEKLKIKKSELIDLIKAKNIQCVNYQNVLIPELIQAMKAANKQLYAGNIKHIEWSQYISQLTDSYNMYYELKLSYIQNLTEYKLLNNEL